MDMTFARGPSASEMAFLLGAMVTTSVIVAAAGIWLRRLSNRSWSKVLAGVLFGTGIAALVLFSSPLLYPHHHHDTVWIPDQWRWNYPIDVAIGLGYWLAIGALWRAWRLARQRSQLAV